MTMIKVNVHEAKANLSRYLELAEQGETVVVCRRNQPIAELRGIPAVSAEPRPIGLARDRFTVPEAFFERLPEELVRAFDGSGS